MQTAITNIPRGNLTPRAGLEALFRQKILCFWVIFVVLFATVFVTILKHRQYASQMKFLVQNTRGNVVISPEKTTQTSGAGDIGETQVNSELELLHSHDVIDSVADPDWAKLSDKQRTVAATRRHEALISAFERRLHTEIVRRTNLITVTVVADSPEKAHDDLEHLSAAYLAEHRQLQRPTGASDFFKVEAGRAREDWDSASRKLVEFQQQHQIVSVSEREATLNDQVTEHERNLIAADASLREYDARLAASAIRLHDLPMRQTTQERVMPNQQSAQVLNTLLVELQNKRTVLLTNFKSDDRFVRELDEEIATTKAALSEATVSTSREKTTDVDPAWQQLRTSHFQVEIARKQGVVHRASVAAELVALRKNLADAQELTVQFNNLEAQANEAKQNYELYAQKRDQAQIEDAMDEQKLLNVAVAQKPTWSYGAVSPKPISNAVLGAVTSIFLALCAVYFAESGRSTIVTPRELDNISRYPVLATLPRMSLWEGHTFDGPAGNSRLLLALPSNIDDAANSDVVLRSWKGAKQ